MQQITADIELLSLGNTNINVNEKLQQKKDEIGDVFRSFARYIETVQEVTVFAGEIGKGEFGKEGMGDFGKGEFGKGDFGKGDFFGKGEIR